MEITSLGHSAFKIRGKAATIVTDPFDGTMVGSKFPAISGDIVTVSHNHPDHNKADLIGGTPMIISGPGEYELKGVRITGIGTFHDDEKGVQRGNNTLFHILIDGVGIVHAGDLGHKLSEEQEENLPSVDILMLPVGGVYTLDAKGAASVVTQLEPKIVIPMHYKTARHDAKTFGELSPVEAFLKEIGKEGILPQPKLVVGRDKLPAELQVVVLE